MSGRSVLQLVAVARPGELTDLAAEGYAESSPPEIIQAGHFDAVVLRIPPDLLSGDAGEKRLADVTWLTPRAAAHERIILRAMQHATIMPIGFGSVFSNAERLSARLAQHLDPILDFLDEAGDHVEWSIKALADRETLLRAAHDAVDDETHDASQPDDGAAYLLRKRHDAELRERAEDLALEALDGFLDRVSDTCTDVTERDIPAADPAADPWPVANVAFMVHRDQTDAFNAAIDEAAPPLERLGIDLELSGPWPCYSFCPRLGDASAPTTEAA